MREIGDTTVQLSWSRGFDNHSPIAKYTLQARTLPGKWKQVRTSKCELPPPQVSPELAWLNAGGGGVGGGSEAEAQLGASKMDKCRSPACRELPGHWRRWSYRQQKSGKGIRGGGTQSAPLKNWQDYAWGNESICGCEGCT